MLDGLFSLPLAAMCTSPTIVLFVLGFFGNWGDYCGELPCFGLPTKAECFVSLYDACFDELILTVGQRRDMVPSSPDLAT